MAVVGGPQSAWLTAPPLLPRPPRSPALRCGWKMRLGWGWGPTQGPWGLRKSHLSPSPPLLFPRPGAFAHMVESMGGGGKGTRVGSAANPDHQQSPTPGDDFLSSSRSGGRASCWKTQQTFLDTKGGPSCRRPRWKRLGSHLLHLCS